MTPFGVVWVVVFVYYLDHFLVQLALVTMEVDLFQQLVSLVGVRGVNRHHLQLSVE